jgi:hypothetical protein
MEIRPMAMGMGQRLVPMQMRVGLVRRIIRRMFVPVVCVVNMAVIVFQRLMAVFMDMALRQM